MTHVITIAPPYSHTPVNQPPNYFTIPLSQANISHIAHIPDISYPMKYVMLQDRLHRKAIEEFNATAPETKNMKVFVVVTEFDGETTKSKGRTSTKIEKQQYRYAAESIQQVLNTDLVKSFLNEQYEGEELVAIYEEHPDIILL